MKKLINLILRFYENDVIRYIFFGGCTTLVNLVCFYVLRKCNLGLNIANIILSPPYFLFQNEVFQNGFFSPAKPLFVYSLFL